jgi:hypothetical protein
MLRAVASGWAADAVASEVAAELLAAGAGALLA